MSTNPEHDNLITRREAVRRVSALLGGIALVGGSSLLTGCRPDGRRGSVRFTDDDVAFLDEVADTILPETSSPGAKAAQTGAFMALMVTDTYDERDQQVFRDGMRTLNDRCQEMHGHSFMASSPQERLALLEQLDREQVEYTRSLQDARRRRREQPPPEADAPQAEAHLSDQRQEAAIGTETSGAAAITADSPSHYFRMMKELAMLGYFTSEIGYNQAMRYRESPGRYDPCVPYEQGQPAWAPHA